MAESSEGKGVTNQEDLVEKFINEHKNLYGIALQQNLD